MTKSEDLERKSFDRPDETRSLGRGSANIANIGGYALMFVSLEPGWRWSEDVKPMVGTESCQANHLIHFVSGRLHVTRGASEEEYGPGDIGHIPSGHDAWVVGNEPVVYLDITGSGVFPRQ